MSLRKVEGIFFERILLQSEIRKEKELLREKGKRFIRKRERSEFSRSTLGQTIPLHANKAIYIG